MLAVATREGLTSISELGKTIGFVAIGDELCALSFSPMITYDDQAKTEQTRR